MHRSNLHLCLPPAGSPASGRRLSRISAWLFGIAVTFTLLLTGCSPGREGAPHPRPSDHAPDFSSYVHTLRCIMPREDWHELQEMPREDREPLIEEFWRHRDPTPTTARNERKEEHFRRLEQLGRESRGYGFDSAPLDSDFATVYIKYGRPDEEREESLPWDHEIYRSFVYSKLEYLFTFDRTGSLVWTNLSGVGDPANFHVCEMLPYDSYSFGAGYMEVSFAHAFFHEKDVTRVEAYYSFPLSELTLRHSADAFSGSYEKGFVAFDAGMVEKMRAVEEVEVVGFGRIPGGKLVTGQLELLLPPGRYQLAISLRDLVSSRIAVCRIDSTPVARPDSLTVGGPILGLAPDAPIGEGPFMKHGIGVIPNPSGIYFRDDTLLLYMELYNLYPSGEGVFLYEGTYTVRGRNILKDPRIFHEIYSSTDPVPWILARIDLSDLPPDDYGLRIDLGDRRNGRRVASDVSFRLIAR